MITNGSSRFAYIDNLRLLMIIFVVMVHLAVTYSGIGSWYLVDSTELGAESLVFFGLFQSFTQAYFMGFLFLISGYFVTKSYDKKGPKKFLKDRFIRLGIPTLIYMLVIHPFIVYVLLGNMWDRPVFIKYYLVYFFSLEFLGESGPLWFAFALLLFNCFYVLYRKINKIYSSSTKKELPDWKAAIMIILLISIVTYIVRLVQPIDTAILNMQLCFFTQYIALFILGIKAGKYDWFSKLSYPIGHKWFLTALIPGILCWIVLMIGGGALDGGFDLYKGGFNWQSAAYAIWESFTAVAMSIGLISLFKEKYNRQSNLIKSLSDRSFTVYMFHAPIIITISLILMNVHMHPILKFLAACVIGFPLTFFICNYIRKIPVLNKIL
ncbi:acyltransferase family protein [Anaerocolumna sedimenticola]|uniref:Acyltransferase family protein n=1 Tax=Anaerocolumna sedimenticola TaxID=2696063 RepID=A0A6P1TTW8_9FIRM|nr:acyltransferase family protein [Anaerocolumna sedimenticola]QHQ62938.1 acyltransferase family protein [Anaerocolumna sedimenticola]